MMIAIVTEEFASKRLDVFVIEQMPRLTRSFVTNLIKSGKVEVNGKVTKPGEKVKTGQRVTVDYDIAELDQIPDIHLPILYEDDYCLVINKPIGYLTHSKGAFNPEASVATFISQKITDKTLLGDRAGIVHRLDRATSGVIICAKTTDALASMQSQFAERKVKKTYIAIVAGHMNPTEAVIDMPIERNPKEPKTFRTGLQGRRAVTHYKVIKSTLNHDLVGLHPETGRTHQLRVHLKQVGHPIVGDPLYLGEPAERLYLHALSLEITLPSKERKIFEAPMPEAFKIFMNPAAS